MTPLVIVHGFMGGSKQWAVQAPLSEHREVIAVDLPGFGNNADLPPIDRIEGFAQWVLTQISDAGIEQFDLMGHSMGGMIVQEIVRHAPERINRLILYGTGSVGVLPGRFETIETSMHRAETDGAIATAKRISATWFLDGEAAEGYAACAQIATQSSLAAILAGLRAMQLWSGKDNLPEITAKTLILWGDQDRTYTWSQIESLWRRIPNASLAIVPDCAHAVHSEAPDLFNALVERFLSETASC